MLRDYGILGIFLLGGMAFGFVILITNWLVRPRKPSHEKETTYECGLDTQGPTWVQFKINYFLYALLFVLFDVETVFLYPWAVAFNSVGLFALVEMCIFIAILALGLWYAWKKGALEWE
ncbi:NAD(P)H-quinone oxidoreductase subunit 3 [Oxobacter pfennigii]|uniref:NADH-quinone oxidoreductase subunit A n=1 Tax=Oxobacter pfennigii TaxID=36849 RepID=A0A0P9AL70_9CLOT|nr:NADH-quinone oxidoreductase subunit A [Oxobacter pfennigii]KPU46103.1 NAD(P)H-quinone oxidoreductase subunit 3 [Oxobacter pfennigii]